MTAEKKGQNEAAPEEICGRCGKIKPLCFCESLGVFSNQRPVLILQHPQEPDKHLGSARLAHLILKNSILKTCLSTPSLSAALGREENPDSWIVLHLGSQAKFQEAAKSKERSGILFFDKKNEAVSMPPSSVRGLVILDGTWSQAKTLWWRNPWLLKLKRAVLLPRESSMYGKLRREPRRECLSTIESIAAALDAVGEEKEIGSELRSAFRKLLQKYRDRIRQK